MKKTINRKDNRAKEKERKREIKDFDTTELKRKEEKKKNEMQRKSFFSPSDISFEFPLLSLFSTDLHSDLIKRKQ